MHNKKIFILNKLIEFGVMSVESFFPKNYSYSKYWREVFDFDATKEDTCPTKKSFSSTLSQLKREGLVQRNGSKMKSFWKITSQGKKYLRETEKEPLPKEDHIQRLIIFDIPEKNRKKRNWLRNELVLLKYKMLQKSVWVGYSPLPEKLIRKIDFMKLYPHVYIFKVQK